MKKTGFTLIEVILVVTVISILATITIVALNPARQLAQSNDTKRQTSATSILNAVYQYTLENGGSFPSNIRTDDPGLIRDDEIDICNDLVPTYLTEMPIDPTGPDFFTDCTDYETSFEININSATGRVTVSAEGAELETIEVTR